MSRLGLSGEISFAGVRTYAQSGQHGTTSAIPEVSPNLPTSTVQAKHVNTSTDGTQKLYPSAISIEPLRCESQRSQLVSDLFGSYRDHFSTSSEIRIHLNCDFLHMKMVLLFR